MRNDVWRIDGRGASAAHGTVAWAPGKSIWNTVMFLLALGLAPFFAS